MKKERQGRERCRLIYFGAKCRVTGRGGGFTLVDLLVLRGDLDLAGRALKNFLTQLHPTMQ